MMLLMNWTAICTRRIHEDQLGAWTGKMGIEGLVKGDEVEDMFILLNEVKRRIPSITAVSSGVIASDYQRLRVESVCGSLGLVSLAYLWKQDQTLLLEEMIRRGITAVTIKVAAMGLFPAKHLWKELLELQAYLLRMKEFVAASV